MRKPKKIAELITCRVKKQLCGVFNLINLIMWCLISISGDLNFHSQEHMIGSGDDVDWNQIYYLGLFAVYIYAGSRFTIR